MGAVRTAGRGREEEASATAEMSGDHGDNDDEHTSGDGAHVHGGS